MVDLGWDVLSTLISGQSFNEIVQQKSLQGFKCLTREGDDQGSERAIFLTQSRVPNPAEQGIGPSSRRRCPLSFDEAGPVTARNLNRLPQGPAF